MIWIAQHDLDRVLSVDEGCVGRWHLSNWVGVCREFLTDFNPPRPRTDPLPCVALPLCSSLLDAVNSAPSSNIHNKLKRAEQRLCCTRMVLPAVLMSNIDSSRRHAHFCFLHTHSVWIDGDSRALE